MKNSVLKHRIGITFILLISITVITIIVLTYFLYEKFYVEKQISLLQSYGQSLAIEFDQLSQHEFEEQIKWLDHVLDVNVIYTSDPMLLSGGLPFETGLEETLITFEERQVLLEGETLVLIREHPRFAQDILAVVIPLTANQGLEAALFFYMPLAAVDEPFEAIRYMLIVIVIFIIIIISLLTRKITNYFVQPVEQMMNVTSEMANGDFSKRLPIDRKDELGQLASSFNTMAHSLEEEDTKRREFLSNVSHELRTPISYLKGYTEAFEEQIVSQDKFIRTVKKEVDYMERLVHDLLDLAQLEGDTYPITQVALPFAQLIEEVIEKFEWSLKNKNLLIGKELDEEIIVSGDEDRLTQVVSNILSNAIRYSNEGGKIDVLLRSDDNQAILTIRDNGIGIPKEDIEKLTERFYRVNKGRTRKDGGTGLGLTIVQQILKLHQGRLTITSNGTEGTTVVVFLPLIQ